jgi:parallel beta-helix repeat protein
VQPGTYVENINFNGHNIVLGSIYINTGNRADIPETIIDGGLSGSAVIFESGENNNAVIIGFTIVNGRANNGGGIFCFNSSPSILNNLIKGNIALGVPNWSGGGGIFCGNSNAYISGNIITKNITNANGGGGGIYCQYAASPLIIRNIISYNHANEGGGGIKSFGANPEIKSNIIINNSTAYAGGGIRCNGDALIINNIVSDNRAMETGGIYIGGYHSDVTIINTICWFNSSLQISGSPDSLSPEVIYSNISGGWEGEGNIDLDPLFVDRFSDNYNLCQQSPCIDVGAPYIFDPDGSRSDIGVYFETHPICELAKIIFVSVLGNDTTGEGTIDNPYRTFQHAINVSNNGDSIIAENGLYEENIEVHSKNILLGSNYVFSYDTLDIINTIIGGLFIDNVIKIQNCGSGVEIKGLTIRNSTNCGILCVSSNPIISNNIVYNNLNSGIRCYNSNPEILMNTIRNNSSDSSGGGIYFYSYCYPTIEDNIIEENTSWGSGGGVSYEYRCYGILRGNKIIENEANGIGGGIFCYRSNPVIDSNSIMGNVSHSHGGGIGCDYVSDPNIINNLINQNIVDSGGGGVYCNYHSHPTIQNNIISANYSFGSGGGVLCRDRSNAMIFENYIAHNITNGNGAGINCDDYSNIYLFGNIIEMNSSDYFGGGIYCGLSDAKISINVINENYARRGGGIYCYSRIPIITKNSIYGNIAAISGGGVQFSSFNFRFYNNLILDNIALYGGGVSFADNSDAWFANNLLNGNLAVDGGGIHINSSNPLINNNILWDDSASNIGDEIFYDNLSTPIVTYNDIEGGWPGVGNINVDPLFKDPQNDNFHLMSIACGDSLDSPCIDAGSPMFDDSLLDCSWGLGNSASDMGAYGGGAWGQVDVQEINYKTPEQFSLSQNYPNPFNATTTIKYALPEAGQVRIDIYDLLGRKVETLVDEEKQAGQHQAVWDASRHSSGVYFYRIEAGDFAETRKMILLK